MASIQAATRVFEAPLSAAVLYTRGKAMGGSARDDELIVQAFERAGVRGESIDLADLSQASDGSFLLRDRGTGMVRPWAVPDAVMMYHGALSPPNTGPMLDALEGAGAFMVNRRSAWETMTDKWKFFQEMQAAGVRTIPTKLVETPEQAHSALRELGGSAVYKKPVSTEGDDVYIVKDAQQLDEEVAGRLPELDGRVIAQPFVESKIDMGLEPKIMDRAVRDSLGVDADAVVSDHAYASAMNDHVLGMRNDFRIMTVRGINGEPNIIGTFHRIAQATDQQVNNVAKGSRAVRLEFSELHPQDQATVLQAMDAMPDGQIVGWDLIGQPGKRYIMEANSGPGLPTMEEGFDPKSLLAPYAELARAGASQSRAARSVHGAVGAA